MHKLQGLVELQQRVKTGLLIGDRALENISDQQVQKGTDATQEVGRLHTVTTCCCMDFTRAGPNLIMFC